MYGQDLEFVTVSLGIALLCLITFALLEKIFGGKNDGG
jgi:hypothetical protein